MLDEEQNWLRITIVVVNLIGVFTSVFLLVTLYKIKRLLHNYPGWLIFL